MPNVPRSPGAIVRAADERWQEAWLAAHDPAPAENLARATRALKKTYGLAAFSDARLLALAQLSIARMQLKRAHEALTDPKRKRQTWLCADVRRAAETVTALARRAAKDEGR